MASASLLLIALTLTPISSDLLDIPGLPDKVYELKGDLDIGGLFPLHQPGENGSYCGKLRELGVLQRAEAMAFYINEINKDTSILPNVKLGFIILDDCYKETTALAQTLKFVQSHEPQNNQTTQGKDVVAVIGAESSTNSKQVAELLGLFKIPQVSYLSTSPVLSNKVSYPYFTRIVPSDKFQITAMVKLVNHFKWQYVSFVFSFTAHYGLDAYLLFMDELKKLGNNICLASDVQLVLNPTKLDYRNALNKLVRGSDNKSAHVVILFLPQVYAVNLLATAQEMRLSGRFTWIASDAWGRNVQDFRGIEKIAEGALTFKINSTNDPTFDEHFSQLGPRNSANPYLSEFWERACNLTDSEKCRSARQFSDFDIYEPDTTISLVKTAVYLLAYRLHEIQKECKNFEENPEVNCFGKEFRKQVTGEDLQGKIRGLQGCLGDVCIDINKEGDSRTEYAIFNLQKDRERKLSLNKIAYYNTSSTGSLNLLIHSNDQMYWNSLIEQSDMVDGVPESICSRPCITGQKQVRSVSFSNSKCCWTCEDCEHDEVTKVVELSGLDTLQCSKCSEVRTMHSLPIYSAPFNHSTVCMPIVPTFTSVSDASFLVIVLLDVVCFIVTCIFITLYTINRNHRLIKATSRELSAVIWTGIIFSYISVVFYFIPLQHGCTSNYDCHPIPQTHWCYIQYFTFNISSTLMTAPLITRVNRIYRIFKEGRKRGTRPRFIENKYQFLVVGILLLIQVVILAVCSIVGALRRDVDGIKVTNDLDVKENKSYIACDIPYSLMLPPVCFNFLLCVACGYHAFKTRKLPDNFNESRYISLTIYTTIIMWIAFIPVYVTITDRILKPLPLCVSLIVNASITTGCLFIPRLYALRWVDRRKMNLRSLSISTSSFAVDSRGGDSNRRKSLGSETTKSSNLSASVNHSIDQMGSIDTLDQYSSSKRVVVLKESSSSSPDSQCSSM